MTVQILVGDALSQLRDMPDGSVHCVVTSPPYWGLRAYKGDPGMIGMEPTFAEHLANLVAVFREVRRVLRSDGTLWLNYADAYGGGSNRQDTAPDSIQAKYAGRTREAAGGSFKAKDLMMMPARVAMALQAEGWCLRSEIIWHKPNQMPESVTDRPTSSHEKLFLMSKSARYFYDSESVRVEAQPDGGTANLRNVWTIAPQSYSEAHFATFPRGPGDPVHQGGDERAWRLRGVRGAVGAGGGRVSFPEWSGLYGETGWR